MKDLDFKRKLNLTPEAREIFLAQIDHDSSVGTTLQFKDIAQQRPIVLQGLGLYNPENYVHYELPTSGITVTFGHAKWGLMLNIMIGIRLSVRLLSLFYSLLPPLFSLLCCRFLLPRKPPNIFFHVITQIGNVFHWKGM